MTFAYGSTCFYSTFIIYYIFTGTIYVGIQKDGFDKVVHIFKNDLQSSGSGPGGQEWEGYIPKSIESVIEDQAFVWVYDSAPRLLKKQIINFLNIF